MGIIEIFVSNRYVFVLAVMVSSMHALPSSAQQYLRDVISVQHSAQILDQEVEFCGTLTSNIDRPIIFSGPFSFSSGGQVTQHFRDIDGQFLLPVGDTIVRNRMPPRPYSTDRFNYDLLMPDMRIQTCRRWPLTAFSSPEVRIRVRFETWLREDDDIPFNETELSVRARPPIGVFLSNTCVLNNETRTVLC